MCRCRVFKYFKMPKTIALIRLYIFSQTLNIRELPNNYRNFPINNRILLKYNTIMYGHTYCQPQSLKFGTTTNKASTRIYSLG
ncbi:hypothetical protein SA19142_22360 [Staphylococcus argenteus]|uniref:Uncharacterized protein n=1 Tax=Staphylococcus argenteus TaxID=985002 RepID=A0A7U7JRA6_9STAP|nr:hypothetical protein BN1326_140199 [Staphylococcus argenteus]CRI15274.1 hypothetical protein BN1326_140199 [Staphylococcus argenteus]BCR33828.1 hypothetical protein SARG0275_22110 [Staphylococcus argenteus]GBU01155.1 hypothetical protein SARG0275_02340 [Staphylococcus argenteus]GJF37421.1 hypothetical protein SA19023_21760 [Staphylococcus argenteus]